MLGRAIVLLRSCRPGHEIRSRGLIAGRFHRRLSGPFGTRAWRTTPAAVTETLAVAGIDVAFGAVRVGLRLSAACNERRKAVNLIPFDRLWGRLRL